MSEEAADIRWLVEEREVWRARALAAEAELVRRDAEAEAGGYQKPGWQEVSEVFSQSDLLLLEPRRVLSKVWTGLMTQAMRSGCLRVEREPATHNLRVWFFAAPHPSGGGIRDEIHAIRMLTGRSG